MSLTPRLLAAAVFSLAVSATPAAQALGPGHAPPTQHVQLPHGSNVGHGQSNTRVTVRQRVGVLSRIKHAGRQIGRRLGLVRRQSVNQPYAIETLALVRHASTRHEVLNEDFGDHRQGDHQDVSQDRFNRSFTFNVRLREDFQSEILNPALEAIANGQATQVDAQIDTQNGGRTVFEVDLGKSIATRFDNNHNGFRRPQEQTTRLRVYVDNMGVGAPTIAHVTPVFEQGAQEQSRFDRQDASRWRGFRANFKRGMQRLISRLRVSARYNAHILGISSGSANPSLAYDRTDLQHAELDGYEPTMGSRTRFDGRDAELGPNERAYFYEVHNAAELRTDILRRALSDISNSAHTVMEDTGVGSTDGDTRTFTVDLERPIARIIEGPTHQRIAQTTKIKITIEGILHGRPAVTNFEPVFDNHALPTR